MDIEQERYPLSKFNRQISKLPSFYTSVPVVVASKNLHVPKLANLTKPEFTLDFIKKNYGVNMYVMLLFGQLTTKMHTRYVDNLSWAVYHNNRIGDTTKTLFSVLLPSFPNDSKSVAMIKLFNGLTECSQYRQPWADTCYSMWPTTL